MEKNQPQKIKFEDVREKIITLESEIQGLKNRTQNDTKK